MATAIAPARSVLALVRRAVYQGNSSSLRLTQSHRLTGARYLHTQRQAQSFRQSNSDSKTNKRTARLGLVAAGSLLASVAALSQPTLRKEDSTAVSSLDTPTSVPDDRDPSLPRYRLSDVREHGGSSPNPWVIFEDKVYDITEWVAAHPGGDVILRAAGASIEPYWKIFTIHNADHVREILSQYLIGFVDTADLVDGRPASDDIEDPFEHDPFRDERLITHTEKPRNAEPPTAQLDRDYRTPNELFYVRNHMWVPVVEEEKGDAHALTVELPDGETREYTVKELRTRFETHKVTAVLQCSGNRRSDMTRHSTKTNGLQWGVGAIGNAEWEGVRLAEVLADAGLKVADVSTLTRKASTGDETAAEIDETAVNPNTHHVQFSGLEAYGASVPLAKALDPRGDVLLAFRMNGQPLPRDHGFPLRALVPGHVAARSVKWLSKIVISDEESTSQWQRRDYKSFGPNEGPNPNWEKAPAIQEMPITSAITGVWIGSCVRQAHVPWLKKPDGANYQEATSSDAGAINLAEAMTKVGFTKTSAHADSVQSEPVALQGYAYSGGGREIARVDVSLDGGKTWDQAELLHDVSDKVEPPHGNNSWAWKRWRYMGQLPAMPLPKDGSDEQYCPTMVVKATDVAYNTQPEHHNSIYNVRGNLATAWHRVRVCPKCTRDEHGDGVTWSTGKAYGCGFRKELEGTKPSSETGKSA